MALNGYARVSTSDQDLTLQTQTLRAAGCEIIRAEKASGSSRTGRSELQLLLEFLRPGDTLMVTRVDRLARSIKDLQDIVYALNQQGVTLMATEQPVDTRSAAGKAFLDILGVFAEIETNLRGERQMEGFAAAKARGYNAEGNLQLIRLRSGACTTRRIWGPRPSPVSSGSGGRQFTGRWKIMSSQRSVIPADSLL